MRILVTSNLYPPTVLGGYERECATVVERLRTEHEVLVLTARTGPPEATRPVGEPGGDRAPNLEVRRVLDWPRPDARGALGAPLTARRAVAAARAALAFEPDLIYVWNGTGVPAAALRVLADSGRPIAFRVCEHWFGRLFAVDQFLRELPVAPRPPARQAWAMICRGVNHLPDLRLDPTRPLRAAISWNSEAIRRMAGVPAYVTPVLERVEHSVPAQSERYERVVRRPDADPLIVFLGRVTPRKGIAVAIEALAAVRGRHAIAARLVIAGPEDAGYGDEMRELARARGVADALQWPGALDAGGIEALLSRAAVVLVPSVWEEPFPLVTLEAAFARVPVVASDVGGIGEGLHHEEHALLFARGDAAGAADAIAQTITAAPETAARVARAHARAQDFRLEPYLEAQARFVTDARRALAAR